MILQALAMGCVVLTVYILRREPRSAMVAFVAYGTSASSAVLSVRSSTGCYESSMWSTATRKVGVSLKQMVLYAIGVVIGP